MHSHLSPSSEHFPLPEQSISESVQLNFLIFFISFSFCSSVNNIFFKSFSLHNILTDNNNNIKFLNLILFFNYIYKIL